MASSTSPCACRMARAASSGSYSDPSVMTRETSTPSWPATAAWSIGGRQVSPRPCLASSAWALMMARSPPLTATYIGSVLLLQAGGQPGGAGQGRDCVVVVHQQQVDAARAARPECALCVDRGRRDGAEAAAERGGRLGGPGQRVAAGGVGERVE